MQFQEPKSDSTYGEYHRNYYAENRERILAYQRQYYRENKNKIKAYNNSDSGKERMRRYRRRKREWLNEIKLESGCVDCGYRDHPAALQFDHRDPAEKEKSVTSRRGISLSWSRERLEAEIAKCDVRCANCHSVRGFTEGHHSVWHEEVGHNVG